MRANLARVGARVASSYGTRASYAGANSAAHLAEAVVCSAIPSGPVGYPVEGGWIDVTAARTAPGQLRLRDAPPGLPESDLRPPTIAESGDPFAAARIVGPDRPTRARPADPDRRRRRSAERDLRRLALHRPRRRRRDPPAPDELDGRLPQRARGSSSTTASTARRSRSRTPAASTRGSSARSSASWSPAASGSTPSAGSIGPAARAEPHARRRPADRRARVLPLSPAGPIPLIGGPLPTSSQPAGVRRRPTP